jgi:hypothetical protein
MLRDPVGGRAEHAVEQKVPAMAQDDEIRSVMPARYPSLRIRSTSQDERHGALAGERRLTR